MVGHWVKALSQVPSPSHLKRIHKNGLTVNYPNIKSKIAEILDVSTKKTKNRSKKLAIDKFKLSTHWLNRFLKCHDLSLRRRTKIAQKLPEDLKNQLLNF
ncbi:31339_t:CDS:2 [Gigaspora margarita]|uniref:31339_t:CDS:1 n=1 Tax=Gigaspora margarita TaxID=4874 RepID=A0ABN7WDA6_GIGMA|nr:31339_t:CDS:2 [Gigaspora margarita]